MGLTDWTDKAGASSFSLVGSPVHTGSKALKLDNSLQQWAIKTLNQSETDAPEEATIKTQLYLENSSGAYYVAGFFFRFANTNNFFALVVYCKANGNIELGFFKKEGGGTSSQTIVSDWSSHGLFGAWHEWEVRFCETPAGTVNLEIYVDGAFKYTSSRSESGLTAGGAVGVGANDVADTYAGDHYFDVTKIYYT